MDTVDERVVAKERLVQDFRAVKADVEELLRATAGQTGEKITSARARVEESLKAARQRLVDVEEDLVARTKAAAKATDQLVRDKPWQAVGVAAAVGFLLGLLTCRR